MTHICVSNLTIIGSDNGLSPDRRQAIIWTNAGLLLIGPLGTNFSEFLIAILTFSFKKMRLKVSSAKRRPFCLGLNELIIVASHEHRGVSNHRQPHNLFNSSFTLRTYETSKLGITGPLLGESTDRGPELCKAFPWYDVAICDTMMTSSNGNILSVTGHLCGEFTGPRWIPLTKASDAELWCFMFSLICA